MVLQNTSVSWGLRKWCWTFLPCLEMKNGNGHAESVPDEMTHSHYRAAQRLPLTHWVSFRPVIGSCLQRMVGLRWEVLAPIPSTLLKHGPTKCLQMPPPTSLAAGTEHGAAPSWPGPSAAGLWAGL